MATETHSILHHNPMVRHEHHLLWAMLAVIALAVIGYAAYDAYYSTDISTEYDTTTVMGNADRAPTSNTTVTR